MNPLSRRSALLLAAVLAALPAWSGTLEEDILERRDYVAAKVYLDNPQFHQPLRGRDAAAFDRVFRAAAETRDVGDIVFGLADAAELRAGFLTRDPSCFCRRPADMLAWYDRLEARQRSSRRRGELAEALLEWDRLPRGAQRALQARQAGWATLDLDDRADALRADYAMKEKDALLAVVPKTDAELRALRRRREELRPLLGEQDNRACDAHLERSAALVQGLADAQRRLGRHASPELRQALADARNAGSLDAALAGLDRVFDGLGVRNAGVDRERPATEAERLPAEQRALLGEMLKTSLLRVVSGTRAGDELNAFYQRVPLNIRIEPGARHTFGWYRHGTDDLYVNQRFIEEFAKTQGRAASDLLTDPALMNRFSVLLSGLFVHEAKHHEQDRWAREQGIPNAGGRQAEREAHQYDTLFFMEKARRDPAYRRMIEEAAATSSLAQSYLGKARRMEQNGSSFFRASIDAWHYPQTWSLESHMWCGVPWHREMVEQLSAELRRRESLPPAERERLEGGPEFPDGAMDREQWDAAVRASGTPHVRAEVENFRQRLSRSTPEVYQAWRRRFAESDRIDDEQARVLISKDPLPERAERGLVPPPPPARNR